MRADVNDQRVARMDCVWWTGEGYVMFTFQNGNSSCHFRITPFSDQQRRDECPSGRVGWVPAEICGRVTFRGTFLRLSLPLILKEY